MDDEIISGAIIGSSAVVSNKYVPLGRASDAGFKLKKNMSSATALKQDYEIVRTRSRHSDGWCSSLVRRIIRYIVYIYIYSHSSAHFVVRKTTTYVFFFLYPPGPYDDRIRTRMVRSNVTIFKKF